MPNLISNLIKNFEFESNFEVVEFEFEPEPCDIGYQYVDAVPLLMFLLHFQPLLKTLTLAKNYQMFEI